MKINSLIKKFILCIVLMYFVFIFINQQTTLNKYKKEQLALDTKIEEEKEHNSTLVSTKENINSPEFIEQVAREKLDMYLPNERVYIDIGK